MIAFLGPDGAGKSTVIGAVGARLAPTFNGVRTLHLRPRLGLPPGDRAPVTDPHAKPPRGAALSSLKVLWFVLDYLAGYWLRTRPLLDRSTLVLFDRYYHDLLVDPARYRYGGPQWLARAAARIVPRPALWVVLDAPAEVLYSRKREVSFDEVHRQRRAYRALADALPDSVVVDTDRALDRVVAEVVGHILARANGPPGRGSVRQRDPGSGAA